MTGPEITLSGPAKRARCISEMVSLQQRRRELGARISQPLAAALRRSPVSPNTLTLLGVAVTFVSAWFAAHGSFFLSGIILGVAALFDMADGALARATGRSSAFGAILDSASDRVSEALLLGGLSLWFVQAGNITGVVMCYIALVASFLVSYLRARGEAVGIDCTVGLCTRPERVIVLALGLLTSFVFVSVSIVAVCASVTVVERLLHLKRNGKETLN